MIAAKLLGGPDIYATTALILVVDALGDDPPSTEAFGWRPEVIRDELQAAYGCDVSEETMDRIAVGISILTTDLFHTHLPTFVTACNVLSGSPYNPEIFDPADAFECAWGMFEAEMLDPTEDPDSMSADIRAYIGQILRHEGFVGVPKRLRIAEGFAISVPDHSVYADDPEMMNAIFDAAKNKEAELERRMQRNFEELQTQLASLRLRYGRPQGFFRNVPIQ